MLTEGVFGEHCPEHSANCKRFLSKLESSSSDIVIFVSWFKPSISFSFKQSLGSVFICPVTGSEQVVFSTAHSDST